MSLPLFLPCAAGVEPLLLQELQALFAHLNEAEQAALELRAGKGGVGLTGGPEEVMRLNLGCRLAQRVLVEVAQGPYGHENDVYELARGVDWGLWLNPSHTLRVDTTARHSPLQSLKFAALRVKDAVCDQQREEFGERPSVDTRHPDLPLLLHLGPEQAWLYVDTSGEPLFKRGWREDVGDAPLKETLAAAMLAACGWQGRPDAGGALHDPCCGSGTIAIEAAQIACDMAPGLQRRFAFERQLPFQSDALREAWRSLKREAQQRVHAPAVPIFASDVAFRMVDFARRNAERAGVGAYIQFNGGDALERPAPRLPDTLPGTLLINPPYGERIDVSGKAARPSEQDRDTGSDFFQRLSAHWKRAYTEHPAGWTAYVLSPDMKLPSAMRLKESQRTPMWNGPIECRLFRFDLIKGSARGKPGGA
jgi:putative N6-adenine-specific DNA methylase